MRPLEGEFDIPYRDHTLDFGPLTFTASRTLSFA